MDVVGLDVQVKASGIEATRGAIRGLDASFKGAQKGAFSLSSTILTLNQGIDLMGRIMRPLRSFGAGFLSMATQAESLQARLVGLTGSTGAAAAEFERMRQIAATTPFQVPDVVQAGVQLRAMGVESEGALTKLTDLAAFMGRDLTEAAFAVGRAFSGGLGGAEILREGGILPRVEAAARSLGFRFNELKDLTLPQFRQALLAAFDDEVIKGSAARISATFEGRLSNLADAWGNLQTKMGQIITKSSAVRSIISTVENVITRAAGAVVRWTNENRELIETGITEWGERLGRILERIPDAIPGILRAGGALRGVGTAALGAIPEVESLVTAISRIAGAWNALPAEVRAFIVTGAVVGKLTGSRVLALAAGSGAAAGALFNRGREYARSPNKGFRFGPSPEAIDLATQAPEFSRFRGASYADVTKAASFGDATAKELNKTLLAIERERKQGLRDAIPSAGTVATTARRLENAPVEGEAGFVGPPLPLRRLGTGTAPAEAGGGGGSRGGGGGGGNVEAELQRRTEAAAEAVEERTRNTVTLHRAKLDVLRSEVGLQEATVARGTELLAAATQVETSERRRIGAEVEGLRMKQAARDVSAEERDAIEARIEGLQQEASLLADVRDVYRDITQEIRQEARGVTALLEGPLAQYRENMRRAREVTGLPGGLTTVETTRYERLQRSQTLSEFGLSDGLEEAANKWRQLDAVAQEFRLTSDQVAKGQQHIVDELNGVGDAGRGAMQELIAATEQWGRNFTETLASTIEGAKGGFHDLVTSLLKDLHRLILSELVTKPLFGAVRDALAGRTQHTAKEVAAAAGASGPVEGLAGAVGQVAATVPGVTAVSGSLAGIGTAAAASTASVTALAEALARVQGAGASGVRPATVGGAPASVAASVPVPVAVSVAAPIPLAVSPPAPAPTVESQAGAAPEAAGVWAQVTGLMSSAAERFGSALSGLLGGIRSGFQGVLAGLASGASAFLSALLGGGGGGGNFFKDFGLAFLGNVISGGLQAAGGALFGGSTTTQTRIPMDRGAQPGYYQATFGGPGRFHEGGVVAAGLASAASSRRLFGGGSTRLAADEVPAILQAGEVVVPRRLVPSLEGELGQLRHAQRFHEGGVVGSRVSPPTARTAALKRPGASGKAPSSRDDTGSGQQVVVNLPTEFKVVSLDPQNAAAVILAHEREIVGMVNRNLRRGGELAVSAGIRRGRA